MQRSLPDVLDALKAWLPGRFPDATDVVVDPNLVVPPDVGNANETICFTATRNEFGRTVTEELVLRIEPTTYQVFPDIDLTRQRRLIQAIGDHGPIPVPRIRWFEEDPTVLGAPFFVMDRIAGRAPGDRPYYNCPGTWVAELSRPERQRLWENAMATFCRLHAEVDAVAMAPYATRPGSSGDGLADELDYWTRFAGWAGATSPTMVRALDRLLANRPAPAPLAFSWGDARIENMLFDERRNCVAVLDWEMAGMAGPMADLGWWLFADRFACAASGVPRLAGLADREHTCRRWLELTGIATDDLAWHEMFAAYRMAALIARIVHLHAGIGIDFGPTFSVADNPALRILHDLLVSPATASDPTRDCGLPVLTEDYM